MYGSLHTYVCADIVFLLSTYVALLVFNVYCCFWSTPLLSKAIIKLLINILVRCRCLYQSIKDQAYKVKLGHARLASWISLTLTYILEHVYYTTWSMAFFQYIGTLKRGLEVITAIQRKLGMKTNCYSIVKVGPHGP